MISANIYSLDTLPETKRGPIIDGIQDVARYMGQKATTRLLKIRLPQSPDGKVNPRRVGFKKLDKGVDLHVMAVPITPRHSGQLRMGLAGFESGIAFVDTHQPIGKDGLEFVSAHETAHAFGFVKLDAFQRDLTSRFHCCRPSCVMHAELQTRDSVMVQNYGTLEDFEQTMATLAKVSSFIYQPAGFDPSQTTTGFCQPCVADMGNFGEQQLNALRVRRASLAGRGIYTQLIG